MIDIRSHTVDRVSFRQSLSLSLLSGRAFTYRGALAFVNANPPFSAYLSDFEQLFRDRDLGAFRVEGDDISFIPKPVRFGVMNIPVNPYSSAVEMTLLLAPALFRREFRSKLLFSGVTHSPLSPGTSWMKESFLAVLEKMGLYASCSLRRFGFYGSGGGALEARVYPAEDRCAVIATSGPIAITGARVCIAHLDASIAREEKEALCAELTLDPSRAGILEVRDCDGAWNHAEVYLLMDGIPLVVSEAVPVYDFDGKNRFSEEGAAQAMRVLARRVRETVDAGRLPDNLVREIVPYAMMTGSAFDVDSYPEAVREAVETAKLFLE
jgi:RNA 3'-terminal phosphate cyclase